MALISKNVLTDRPQEVGKIKIGRLGPEKKTRKGAKMRQPEKLDHFIVVTPDRGEDGNYLLDEEIHAKVGPEPRELDGVLMYETPEENWHSELLVYEGHEKVRSCDGVTFLDIRTGAEAACPKAAGGECPCKPYGRLHIQLNASPNVLGFHVYRTTGWGSVGNIQGALYDIYRRFGTLYHAPVRLRIYRAEDTYRDGGKVKTATSYKVQLVLAMTMEEVAALMVERGRTIAGARDELRRISGEVQRDLTESDRDALPDIAGDVVEEVEWEVVDTPAAPEGGPDPAPEDDQGEEDEGPVHGPATPEEMEELEAVLVQARGLGKIGLEGEESVREAKQRATVSGEGVRTWTATLRKRIEEPEPNQTSLLDEDGEGDADG